MVTNVQIYNQQIYCGLTYSNSVFYGCSHGMFGIYSSKPYIRLTLPPNLRQTNGCVNQIYNDGTEGAFEL